MASLYRMYGLLCANDLNQLMLETQCFWNSTPCPLWSFVAVPDRRDGNLENSAILASLIEGLVLASNYRYELGL